MSLQQLILNNKVNTSEILHCKGLASYYTIQNATDERWTNVSLLERFRDFCAWESGVFRSGI